MAGTLASSRVHHRAGRLALSQGECQLHSRAWLALRQGECQQLRRREPTLTPPALPPDEASDLAGVPLPAEIPITAWEHAAALPDDPGPTDLTRLRAAVPQLPTETWTFVVNQTMLRRRATAKLGPEASRMLLTEAGLQQASRPAVAVRRFRQLRQQGWTAVSDLGCGLGVDAAAAARAGLTVDAVELDPQTAAAAEHNLAVLAPDAAARLVCGDVRRARVPADHVAFLDPGRRRGHHRDGTARRVGDPEQWQPPWSWIDEFTQHHPATVVKAAPGIDRDLPGDDVAVEWVSVAGHLVEADLWFPGVRDDRAARSATLLPAPGDPWAPGTARILSGNGVPAPVHPLGSWLLEPDPAIIRSGLVGELADLIAAGTTSEGIAYLTGDATPPIGWGRVSTILEVLPARVKPLRAGLRARDLRPTEIRTRGLNLDPQQLRTSLPTTGSPVGLVVTRVAGRPVTLLVADDLVPGR